MLGEATMTWLSSDCAVAARNKRGAGDEGFADQFASCIGCWSRTIPNRIDVVCLNVAVWMQRNSMRRRQRSDQSGRLKLGLQEQMAPVTSGSAVGAWRKFCDLDGCRQIHHFAACKGRTNNTDFGFGALGFGGGGAGAAGAYSETQQGRAIAAAFLDSCNEMGGAVRAYAP